MPRTVKKTVEVTSRFRFEHHPENNEFVLIVSEIEVEDIVLEEVRVVLPEDMLRQMAELLPPPDIETVH